MTHHEIRIALEQIRKDSRIVEEEFHQRTQDSIMKRQDIEKRTRLIQARCNHNWSEKEWTESEFANEEEYYRCCKICDLTEWNYDNENN